MPLAPLLLMPSLAGSPGAVDVPASRTADFTFSWDARGASESLQLVVNNPLGDTGQPWLSCNFDAPAGTGTFQVGALSQLPVGTLTSGGSECPLELRAFSHQPPFERGINVLFSPAG